MGRGAGVAEASWHWTDFCTQLSLIVSNSTIGITIHINPGKHGIQPFYDAAPCCGLSGYRPALARYWLDLVCHHCRGLFYLHIFEGGRVREAEEAARITLECPLACGLLQKMDFDLIVKNATIVRSI
jgi:hypothetical protein